jgi:hypothetical protein
MPVADNKVKSFVFSEKKNDPPLRAILFTNKINLFYK